MLVYGPGHIGTGALINRLAFFAGEGDRENVNQILLQPFLNYNLSDGWNPVSAPAVIADWEASSDDPWTVPMRGGLGKLCAIGTQRMNVHLQAYGNVIKSDIGPDSMLRFTLPAMFPKPGHRGP